jgi:hypothetical protein
VPIVRKTVQGGSRDVVRFRVVIDYRDIREGVVVERRKGDHVEKLNGRLAKHSSRVVRAQFPKPEENLDGTGMKPPKFMQRDE